MKNLKVVAVLSAIALASTVGLAGCSNSEHDSDLKINTATTGAPEPGESATSSDSDDLTASPVIFDGYVAATTDDMTAAYGKLTNKTDSDIEISEISGSVDATYEFHEVVDGEMQKKDGGITIPAQGSYELKPGGDHIMLLNLKAPINAGDFISLTLTSTTGEKYQINNIPVRQQASGQENYGKED